MLFEWPIRESIQMPRFRSFSDVIHRQIEREVYVSVPPPASPASLYSNSVLGLTPPDDPQSGVFRWGFSAWGIDAITPFTSADNTSGDV